MGAGRERGLVGVRSLNELNGEKDGVTGSGLVDVTSFSTSRIDWGTDDGRMGQALIWLEEW